MVLWILAVLAQVFCSQLWVGWRLTHQGGHVDPNLSVGQHGYAVVMSELEGTEVKPFEIEERNRHMAGSTIFYNRCKS